MAASAESIQLVRRFNRFYTRRIGLLREGLLDTPFSLTQARVLFEIASQPGTRSALPVFGAATAARLSRSAAVETAR